MQGKEKETQFKSKNKKNLIIHSPFQTKEKTQFKSKNKKLAIHEPIQSKEKKTRVIRYEAEQVNYLTFFLLAKSFASKIESSEDVGVGVTSSNPVSSVFSSLEWVRARLRKCF